MFVIVLAAETARLVIRNSQGYYAQHAVAISSELIVVGATNEWAGTVSVFDRTSFDCLKELEPDTPQRFGAAVAVGRVIVVGSQDSAFVYDKDFRRTANLTGDAADFGIAVAVSDDYIVVGSSGCAFVYRHDFSLAVLTGSDGFGGAVAVGFVIAVGSNGLVSLYDNGTETHVAPYGCALAANARLLVVGDCANRAQIYNRSVQLTATLENFAVRDRPVGVADDLVVVGNYYTSNVYRSDGSLKSELRSSDADAISKATWSSNLAYSIAGDGDVIVVGTDNSISSLVPEEDWELSIASAYVFVLDVQDNTDRDLFATVGMVVIFLLTTLVGCRLGCRMRGARKRTSDDVAVGTLIRPLVDDDEQPLFELADTSLTGGCEVALLDVEDSPSDIVVEISLPPPAPCVL